MPKFRADPAIGIVGIGSDTPEKVLTNEYFEQIVDTSDQWILERTGIRTRHVVDGGATTSTLAVAAARKALEDAGIEGGDVDLIVVGTATPDMLFPTTACLIQREIGAVGAAAFDLAAACTGFIYGLNVAAGLIRNGTHATALVIGAETLSTITDYEDRTTCVLFGDGAGAVVLRKVESGKGILATRIRSDGRLADMLKMPGGGSLHPPSAETVAKRMHYIRMNGNNVFKSAIKSMAGIVREGLDDAHLSPEDIDLFIPHQANMRIIEATAKKLGFPMEKVLVNVDRYGNTSAASIPIGIDEARRTGRLKDGDLLAVVAFGSGFTWGMAVIRL